MYILKNKIIEFPNEPAQNYLVLKGIVYCQSPHQMHQFPVKIIIPQGFPFHPPRVYLDMQISLTLLKQKTYLGDMNIFKIPYLTNWTSSHSKQQRPNLADLIGYLTGVMASDPPIEQGINAAMMGGQYFPPQQNAVPNQQVQQNYQQQQQPYNYGGVGGQQVYGQGAQGIGSQQDNNEIQHKIDKLGAKYCQNAQETLNKLIESKVQLHQNKKIIEEQLETLRQSSGNIDANIQIMQQQNARMEQFINEIIHLTAKENAYEDCLAAMKKAYEKDQLNLQDFLMVYIYRQTLQNIRKLSGRQFKSTLKRNKLISALTQGAGGGIKA